MKFSKRIAERICELRTRQDIKTTKDLEDILFDKNKHFIKLHFEIQ